VVLGLVAQPPSEVVVDVVDPPVELVGRLPVIGRCPRVAGEVPEDPARQLLRVILDDPDQPGGEQETLLMKMARSGR